MSQIIKKVPNFVPPGQTYQVFTEADAVDGDILMIKDSLLGHPASHVNIDATSAIIVKFNVVQKVYPQRVQGDGFSDQGLLNISLGEEYIASGEMPDYTVGAGETFELENDFPVSDIMVVSGENYTILVS